MCHKTIQRYTKVSMRNLIIIKRQNYKSTFYVLINFNKNVDFH